MNLVRTDTFTPITATGIHNIATITISYLSFCSANYFSNDCSVYCLEGDSDITGYYTCDYNNGDKICKDGYTNPANDCRDQQSQCKIADILFIAIMYHVVIFNRMFL